VPVTISIKAKDFGELNADLFNILSDSPRQMRLEIQKKKLVFSTTSGFSITVQTEEAINRFSLIEFISSPGFVRYGSDAWLTAQSDMYPTVLVIDTDGWRPTVNTDLSK